MSCSNCNNSCNHHNESNCGRVGERILVNQSSCGCGQRRNRCSCANTYRPGCGCQINRCNNNSCGCGCERNRPCPPKPRPCPSPVPPRPCCEDRCRMQYRQCMRNCRMREQEHDMDGYDEHMNCGCDQD